MSSNKKLTKEVDLYPFRIFYDRSKRFYNRIEKFMTVSLFIRKDYILSAAEYCLSSKLSYNKRYIKMIYIHV